MHAARTMDLASCKVCRGIVCPSQAVACRATQPSSNERDELGHAESLQQACKLVAPITAKIGALVVRCQVNGL